MRGADGTVCPMHTAAPALQASDEHAGHVMAAAVADPTSDADQAAEECRMRGTCEGPAVALSTLFSVPGIMPADAVAITLPVTTQLPQLHSRLLTPPSSQDTPPPKA